MTKKKRNRICKQLLKKFFVLDKEIFKPTKHISFSGMTGIRVRCTRHDEQDTKAELITQLLQDKLTTFVALSDDPFSPTSFSQVCGYTLVFKSIERTNRYVYITFELAPSFKIERGFISAKNRKLAAQWTVNVSKDITSLYGVNPDCELVNVMSKDVAKEIDRQVKARYLMP